MIMAKVGKGEAKRSLKTAKGVVRKALDLISKGSS
jgi:hypothetical protein